VTTSLQSKLCKDCNTEKPISEYHGHKGARDRLQAFCKPCCRQRNIAWRERNPHKLVEYQRNRAPRPASVRRDQQLRREYGIDQNRYNELLDQQHGRCAICKEVPAPISGKRIALVVDHCHETNRIRGLLCTNCNVAIGHMKDDVERLRAAISYLEDK
jgi:hypothetical protein